MIHHYLENHGLNSTIVHLNADNCSGQNKNNAVIHIIANKQPINVKMCLSVFTVESTNKKKQRNHCRSYQLVTPNFHQIGVLALLNRDLEEQKLAV